MKRISVYKQKTHFTWKFYDIFFPKGVWVVADSIEGCIIDMYGL